MLVLYCLGTVQAGTATKTGTGTDLTGANSGVWSGGSGAKSSPGASDVALTGDKLDRQGIMITGIPGHCIENVELENIKISFPGGGTRQGAERIVPEDIARYPEQFFFGVLPSCCLYARHVKGLSLKNISMTLEKSDARLAIITDDAEAVRFVNVTINGSMYEANK